MSVRGSIISIDGVPPRPRDYDPREAGAQLRIIDRSLFLEAPVVDLTGTVLRGGRGCGGRAGWRRVRNGFVYRNETNALPPDCLLGSAGGLTRLRLENRTAVRVKPRNEKFATRPGLGYEVDLATAWRPTAGARIATTVVLGDASSRSATVACGTVEAACVASGAGVRCE